MDLSEISQAETQQLDKQQAELAEPTSEQAQQQCHECGAGVDDRQRYCVTCGAHLKHAYDPAARYLTEADSRRAPSAATMQPPKRHGLGLALGLALIPVAAAVGVLAGRSSNNQDSQLIQALARRQGAITVTSSAAPRSHSVSASPRVHHARGTSTPTRHAAPKSSTKAISTTTPASVSRITGSKPTKSQEQQGASATQQVQKSTGKNYVKTQNNLPSQVVVP